MNPFGTYAVILAGLLGADLINLGFSGNARLEEEMAVHIGERDDWDLATVEMGINVIDIWEVEEFKSKADRFVSILAEKSRRRRIFCTDLFLSTRDFTGDRKITAFRKIMEEKVKSMGLPNLVHIGGRELLRSVSGLTADLVHPSSAGMEETVRNRTFHKKWEGVRMSAIRHPLHFTQPISRWDEALPLGNGLSGCLVWGDGDPLHFSLDRGDLWDTRPNPEILAEDYTYENLIELVRKKDQESILKRYDSFYGTSPIPTKIPTGRLDLCFGRKADSVESTLSLQEATAEVNLIFGDRLAQVRTFLSAAEPMGYIRVDSIGPLPEIRLLPPRSVVEVLQYPEAELGGNGGTCWYIQRTLTELQYAIVATKRLVHPGRMEIAYKIACSSDGVNWLEEAKARVAGAVQQGMDTAAAGHTGWWKQFWDKSTLCLPDQEMEKLWYLMHYFLGSCSRKGAPPMPLQGVWTADEGTLPPWKGDYHHDLNTQLCYGSYMKANHLEEGEAFLDFLWELVPEAREFARKFFDAPGICLPSIMSIDAKPLGGWTAYCTNLINQAWLCQAFEHYYLYTGDEAFLKEKAYPYFKETAECILRWLKPGKDGLLVLPLSSSPEIHDNKIESWVTPNSNFDLSLLKYLFQTLEKMASQLGLSEEKARWNSIDSRLPDFAINEKNVLMLCPDETLMESHRHFSHAMPVHPMYQILYHGSERERQIIDATIGNLEALGKGLWVGFSYPWMANLYALQGNGEAAWYQLKLFWDNFCSPNGFNLNGDYKNRGICAFHYRPFTLEANMAAADALQEMVLQNYDGVIRVFPAIPEEWRRKGTSFRDFRAHSGVLVSAAIAGGRVEYVSLKAEKAGTFLLQNGFGVERLRLERDTAGGMHKRTAEVRMCGIGDVTEIRLQAGDSCRVTANS